MTQHDVQIIPPFIQDTTNNEATTSLTLHGDLLYSCGTYPPKFAQFSLAKHSTLFYRHVEHDILRFNVLDDNKFSLLMANRNIQFHTLSKCIYTTKLPGIATLMQYSKFDNNLYFGGNDLYALNLTTGQYEPSIQHSVNRILGMDQHSGHHLLAIGGELDSESGILNIIDHRSGVVATLDTNVITACKFSEDGFHLATGDVEGNVNIYDIRQYNPISTIVHQYASPIKQIHEIKGHLDSYWGTLCEHQLKVSRYGKIECTVEPDYVLNDFIHYPNSGLFLLAGDSTDLTTAYVPEIGPAPSFALFMDQFNETVVENKTEYEHYKFITKPELRKLGLDQFIGTDLLKPVMHGFYCHHRLIDTAKHVMLDYSNYREQEIEQKVNAKIENKTSKKEVTVADSRFQDLDGNAEFNVDENADEYKRLKPTKAKTKKNSKMATKQRKYKDESDTSQSDIEENVMDMPTFEEQIQDKDVRGNVVYEFQSK